MVYKWLFNLSSTFSSFNVFQYITVRSFLAFFTAFFVCWFLGRLFISKMDGFGEEINKDGPQSHHKKKGIPSMGGSFILLGLLVVCILWVDLYSPLIWGVLVLTFGFAFIGFWDDWLKIKRKRQKGVRPRYRLLLELVFSAFILFLLVQQNHLSTMVYVPVFKNLSWDMGWLYILFGAFVITGCANAVNLTDGLDGLAIFPVLVCSATLGAFAYVTGHSELASYLQIPFVSGVGELTPLLAAVVASGLGFLWYNSYPAQIFMGDVGSLGLGGLLGTVAVLTKNELLLLVLGGLFVVEALSVIFQVASYKLMGKRVFKMAPLHHHFELKGIEESKIIVRFWIISILLAVLCLATLKIR